MNFWEKINFLRGGKEAKELQLKRWFWLKFQEYKHAEGGKINEQAEQAIDRFFDYLFFEP